MKHSDTFLKAAMIVICGVVALYVAFSMIRPPESNYTTYKAVRYEVGDGITTSGFLVREEHVLISNAPIIVLERTEGERVGAGQRIASSYTSESARQRQAQIDALEAELAQMEYAHSYSGSDNSNGALDQQISTEIQTVNCAVMRQDFSGADTGAEQLKSYVLRRYITAADAEVLQQRITETRRELEALRAEAADQSGSITVNEVGYFSGTADGYETILTPTLIETIGVAELEQIDSRRLTVPENAIGKLVTNPRWYYVTIVQTDGLRDCKEGDYLTVQFAYDFFEPIRMRISRIGKDEDGRCVLVLTTDRFLSTAITGRAQSADLIFADKSGLRIPKTALYVIDGIPGVYVLSGIRAVWKPVEIIYDNGEYFIVKEDKSSTSNLWPDDEIILTTEEIYHGKVMGDP